MRVARLRAVPKRRPKTETWLSAAGLVIGLSAAVVAYLAYDSAHKDWQLKTTADIITEWNKTSPPNAPHCFDFLSAFDSIGLGLIVARQETPYQENAQASLKACISDQKDDEIKTLVNKDLRMLKPRGAFFVGERVDSALSADSVVAALIVEGIGRSDILNDKIGRVICRYDLKLLHTLHKVPKRENSYPSILKFAQLKSPLGCHRCARCLLRAAPQQGPPKL
jgi:hypothetical protein